ncbi:hypothetical protein [Parafrankia sp. FMc2]|uniref:hypothetical protein n=1 Tax=Parafrankia sp. FMc2 TaxID=3233196 RepID=UPI0034D3B7A0
MPWITVATLPIGSIDQYDAVLAQLGGEPDGLVARYVGTADGTLRVVALWESQAHADQFFARTLGPALARALGPEPAGTPELIGIDVARSYVREPAAGVPELDQRR